MESKDKAVLLPLLLAAAELCGIKEKHIGTTAIAMQEVGEGEWEYFFMFRPHGLEITLKDDGTGKYEPSGKVAKVGLIWFNATHYTDCDGNTSRVPIAALAWGGEHPDTLIQGCIDYSPHFAESYHTGGALHLLSKSVATWAANVLMTEGGNHC